MAILVDEDTKLRRPGTDRPRGLVPRPAQPRVRHRPGRRRDARARAARTSRACRSSTRCTRRSPRPAPTPRWCSCRRRSPPTRSTRPPTPGIETIICITEGIPAHDMLRVYNYLKGTDVAPDRPQLPGRAVARARRTSGSSRRTSSPPGGVGLRVALGHADLPDRQRAGPARRRQLDDRRHRRRPDHRLARSST